jgi:outer membrane protein assembly factor BamB
MIRFAFALLLLASPLRAADWPEFRGPAGNGHVTEGTLPLRWSDKTATWKEAVPGKGWSSPVVVAGRVYLTSAVPAQGGQSLRVLCLDAKNGKTLWNEEVFKQAPNAPRIHNKNSHASPTPIAAGERLYVHFGHQGTACLDLSGKVLWQNVQRYSPVHGNGGSPVLVDDLLIFSCDGDSNPYVIGLDAATGKQRWKTPRPFEATKDFSFSTPLVLEVKGQKQVISPGSNQVNAFDPKTGKILWSVRYEGYSLIPKPVYGQGLVFVCTGYDSPSLYAIRPDGTGDVTDTHVAWKRRRGVPHTASLLVVGEELYMVSDRGIATCVDAKTGNEHWSERLDGDYSASPVYADGRVYFQNEAGLATVLRAGKKFERLAKNDLQERTLASYAVADGALFLRTEKHLYRFEAK